MPNPNAVLVRSTQDTEAAAGAPPREGFMEGPSGGGATAASPCTGILWIQGLWDTPGSSSASTSQARSSLALLEASSTLQLLPHLPAAAAQSRWAPLSGRCCHPASPRLSPLKGSR